jgi:hypothetical protein
MYRWRSLLRIEDVEDQPSVSRVTDSTVVDIILRGITESRISKGSTKCITSPECFKVAVRRNRVR